MKKQSSKQQQTSNLLSAGQDRISRALLVAAIVLYSVSLVLLANLAWAESANSTGVLVKVNNRLDGNAFAELDADVKTVSGNILSMNVPTHLLSQLSQVEGICSSHADNRSDRTIELDNAAIANRSENGVVIGILNNLGTLNQNAFSALKKIERGSNVGFVSYVSTDPTSTVIMHNLFAGESNLVQALVYMQEYARTVEKPLVIELNVEASAMQNPLFVQVCQKFAENGVSFHGADISFADARSTTPIQLAFSTYCSRTGKVIDRSDFWAIEEVKDQQIMLLGSDDKTCSIFFQTEAGFDKTYVSNSSEDMVMLTAITADGSVYYYAVENKETALIPRLLPNGVPVLEDGLSGIFPHSAKGAIFQDGLAKNQFVTLSEHADAVSVNTTNNVKMQVSKPEDGTLAMHLDNLCPSLQIEITDERGAPIYRSKPDSDTKSIRTRIDLSEGVGGLYFLDLTSPEFQQTFALRME